MTPRFCLRWKPTGKIFKTVGLRCVPTRKIFTSSITKVESEPTNGSDEDITNQYEYKQTLDVDAGTLNLSAGGADVLVLRTSKYGESNAYTLEDLTLLARNPVKEVLPKFNLPNHRYKRRCCSLIPTE
ncbi:hypothetical protein Tco_0260754 [Tanacetum coccineum]